MIAAALAGVLAVAGVPVYVTGARRGVTPVTAQLSATPAARTRTIALDFFERHSDGVIRTYDWDMTKKVHLIVVSDDLHTFMHVHPVLGSDGHFRMLLALPRSALYHLYADGVPHLLGRQVFRFDVPVDARTTPFDARKLTPTGQDVSAGPYRVGIDKTTIPVSEAAIYTVHITQNGRPATDLRPYLGAMGHGVLIGSDLSYMHVHAMDDMMMQMMGSDDCGDALMTMMAPIAPTTPVPPTLQFYLSAPKAGMYSLWFQFKGADRDYVARFTMEAR